LDNKVLIVDKVDGEVYYRTWIDGKWNGAWRKNKDEFYKLIVTEGLKAADLCAVTQ
jgi:hypothetical protein